METNLFEDYRKKIKRLPLEHSESVSGVLMSMIFSISSLQGTSIDWEDLQRDSVGIFQKEKRQRSVDLNNLKQDKHFRQIRTDDMKGCSFLVRNKWPCKNRAGEHSDVCQFHEPIYLQKQKELSNIPRSQQEKKEKITRISASQKRMFNPCATPSKDEGCLFLPSPEMNGLQGYFSNPSLPIHIDIGCARGRLLFDLATHHPGRNFIGVEIREKLAKEANEHYQKYLDEELLSSSTNLGRNLLYVSANLLNASHRLQLETALSSLASSLPNSSPPLVDCVSVLFPDPWFKRKHLARRVVQIPLVDWAGRVLCEGGRFLLVSDVDDIVNQGREVLRMFCRDREKGLIGGVTASEPQDISEKSEEDELEEREDNSEEGIISEDMPGLIPSPSEMFSPYPSPSDPSSIPPLSDGYCPLGPTDPETGLLLTNPLHPFSSERENVCDRTWRRVMRVVFLRDKLN